MFGSRRHRPPAQPLTRETANPNAATAAASAFARREPSVSLSSAAAAAALKARPTTPTNVAEVQSKRAMRRSASVSSVGSRDRGRKELHRSPSSSSMTERTFRSPSPGRGAAPRSNDADVPPVPTLPKDEQYQSGTTSSTHKRATSLQVQPFRTASQKMKDGQGSWFGAARVGDLSNVRRSDAILETRHSDERPNSPSSSINFSYPRSKSDAGLGRSASTTEDHTLVYDANSRRMVPRSELYMREQIVKDAPEKPVKKRRHGVSRGGSHLAKGNVSRVKGTAIESPPVSRSPPPIQHESEDAAAVAVARHVDDEDRQQIPEPPADKESTPIAKEPEPQTESQSDSETGLESESDVDEPLEVIQRNNEEAIVPPSEDAGTQPPVTHDHPSPKDEHDQHQKVPHSEGILIPEETSPNTTPDNQDVVTQDQAPQIPTQGPIGKPTVSAQRIRVHSESPARTPHFAATTDQLLVRHEPPSRSLSPRKSAMKHRSPTRNASPSEDGSEASSAIMGTYGQEDSSLARRKSVRVSFDDQNTIVGESAEATEAENQLPSPQNKKVWHSIIGRTKRDSVNLDDDEKMTPRPALPSFGSIREKKTRELEERPLVRPSERAWAPSLASPASQSTDLGQSSDVAIGSILAQEQSSRNAANISRYREPLPPIVTSVDSSGHISISSDDDSEPENSAVQSQPARNGTPPKNEFVANQETGSDESIPIISISKPNTLAQDEARSESPETFFDLPGGSPGEEGSTLEPDESQTTPLDDIEKPHTPVESKSATNTTTPKHPPPIITSRSESVVASPPSPLIHDIQEEEEEDESEGDSIYSDAYEDLSDIEGDGFMSLDAIVDTPVIKVPQKLPEKMIAKSKEVNTAKIATPTNAAGQEHSQMKGDWENAKAYWKSLSTEKRRQLEQEAMEEAGEEADLDEVLQPPKMAKKRTLLGKSQQEAATEKPRNPERVYQIQPGTSWPMTEDDAPPVGFEKGSGLGGMKLKKSLRSEEPGSIGAGHSSSMRKSMRSGGSAPAASSQDGRLRKSLRTEPDTTNARMRAPHATNGSAVEKNKSQRPASYQISSTTEPIQNPRRNMSADRATSSLARASTNPKPSLRRRGSDSSESSFRRSRVGVGEGLGFKKTMRGSVRDSGTFSDGGKGSSRFSLRSLSPTSSNFRNPSTISPTPMAMSGRMRHSMRSNSSDGGSTRRMPGFSRSTGKKDKKAGSRFADSSDDEDARPAFRSRFADSSDEEDSSPRVKGNGMARVSRNKASSSAAAAAMGVLQSQREGDDSPDLPDSEVEIDPPVPNDAITQSPGSQMSGTSRPGHTRRGSFMSILRRKKDSGGKISRPLSESAARRDTRLERSTEELAMIRNVSNQRSARLHKRDRNWPLEDGQGLPQNDDGFDDDESNTYVNEDKRPSTASGVGSSLPISPAKQGFLKRRSTSQSVLGGPSYDRDALTPAAEDHSVGHEIPDIQKKKKFGTLRKMFGLHD